MPNTIYGPNGMTLGTWEDFWNRYQLPEATMATEGAAGAAVDNSSSSLGRSILASDVIIGASDIVTSLMNARTQKAMYQMQAEMNDINKRIAERQAQSALRQSEYKIAALTLQAGQTRSSQRASLAANGIQLGTGTAAELTTGTQLMKEIDMNTEKLNGVMSAWGYRLQAVNASTAATESRLRASQSDGLSAALGAAGRSYGQFKKDLYQLGKVGLLGD